MFIEQNVLLKQQQYFPLFACKSFPLWHPNAYAVFSLLQLQEIGSFNKSELFWKLFHIFQSLASTGNS